MRLPVIQLSVSALWLGASVVALNALPCEAHAEAKTTLRWRFQKGERLHYVLDADSVQDMKVPIPVPDPLFDVKSTTSRTLESAWSVEDVATDGTARISLALERVRIAVKAPGGELSEDTKSETPPMSERSKALRDVIGGTLAFRMTQRGEVKDIKLSDRLAKAEWCRGLWSIGGRAQGGHSADRAGPTTRTC